MHPRIHVECTCPPQHANHTHCILYATAFDVHAFREIRFSKLYFYEAKASLHHPSMIFLAFKGIHDGFTVAT